MAHYYDIRDAKGDTVDLVAFCSDDHNRAWCRENDRTYQGWNGCHEGSDAGEWCAYCGVIVQRPSNT